MRLAPTRQLSLTRFGVDVAAFLSTFALGLLREVEERGDLGGLVSEPDRKVDETSDLERRGGEVNRPVSPARDVTVLAAAVIRENDPLVLPLPQVVPDELADQRVGEMLQDVL